LQTRWSPSPRQNSDSRNLADEINRTEPVTPPIEMQLVSSLKVKK
jgi:hypothetical protein